MDRGREGPADEDSAARLSARLADLSESGMGYQFVQMELWPRHVLTTVVLGGRVALERDGLPRVLEEERSRERLTHLRAALRNWTPDIAISVLTRVEAGFVRSVRERSDRNGPASESPPEPAEPGEPFLRFSAFADDIRIRADGSVTRGTYVTTRNDGLRVETGTQAVERYALPNADPAIHRFHLRPPEAIVVQRGTVQPAHGHAGGGVEVIFVDGATAGTCHHKDRIPA